MLKRTLSIFYFWKILYLNVDIFLLLNFDFHNFLITTKFWLKIFRFNWRKLWKIFLQKSFWKPNLLYEKRSKKVCWVRILLIHRHFSNFLNKIFKSTKKVLLVRFSNETNSSLWNEETQYLLKLWISRKPSKNVLSLLMLLKGKNLVDDLKWKVQKRFWVFSSAEIAGNLPSLNITFRIGWINLRNKVLVVFVQSNAKTFGISYTLIQHFGNYFVCMHRERGQGTNE